MPKNNNGSPSFASSAAYRLSLLPGIETTLHNILDDYNSILHGLSLPTYTLVERDGMQPHPAPADVPDPPTTATAPQVENAPEEREPVRQYVAKKRTMSPEVKQKMSKVMKKRWAAARRGGKTKL